MPVAADSANSGTPAPLALGCVTFGREIAADAAQSMMDFAAQAGWTMFDTAAAYGGGASERIVGEWLRQRPTGGRRPLVATKLLPPYDATAMIEKIRASLERLQLASIDVLYLHQWHETARQPAVLAALHAAVEGGLVRALGASNFSAEQMERALALQAQHGFARFRYLQNIHNYAVSAFEPAVVELCMRAGVERVGYSPLGAGFLTGKYRDGVPAGTRFDIIPGHQAIYFTAAAKQRLARLLNVAERTGCGAIDLALAWAMRSPAVSLVLIGGRSTVQLQRAIAAPAKVPVEAVRLLEDA